MPSDPMPMLPDRLGWRQWAALVVLGSFRRIAAHRFFAWTLLPGDQVHDYLRMLDGVVVRIQRPGQAEVVWATAETLHQHRFRGCLELAQTVTATGPVWIDGRPVVWRESVPAVRLAPGWRYSRP